MSEYVRSSHQLTVGALEEIEEGDSLRVVTSEEDLLARANEDACEHEWGHDRVVLVQVTVYGDTRCDHEVSILSWWEQGLVMLGEDNFEPVERFDRL